LYVSQQPKKYRPYGVVKYA